MKEYKSEFLNEIAAGRADFTDEDFAAIKQFVERRNRATAPAAAAPMEYAPAPSTSIGMFMPSTVPELRGRENLGTFLKRFRTWACVSRCDSALDTEIVVKMSGTPLAELERLHDRRLVENLLKAWQALTKALEKRKGDHVNCDRYRGSLRSMACTDENRRRHRRRGSIRQDKTRI